MELRYLKGNPSFPFESKEGGVQSVWEMKLTKGETVAPHAHPVGIELYVVLDGIGEIKLGDDSNAIFGGDVVYIPPRTPHSASNTTDQPLHVVGVLWEPGEQEAEHAADNAVLPRSISASTAISQIARLTGLADSIKKSFQDAPGAPAPGSKERMADLLESGAFNAWAIMLSPALTEAVLRLP